MSLASVAGLGSVLSSESGGGGVDVDFDATLLIMVGLFVFLWIVLKPLLFDPMLRLFEERERQVDKADGRFVDEQGVTRGMTGRRCLRHYGVPRSDAQDNFTDPDSRIMPTASGGFEQCYNAQAAVDEGSELIVGADLTNSGSECAMLVPMLDQVECNTGAAVQMLLADTNYASEAGFKALEDRGTAACVALGREAKQRAIKGDLPATRRMARWLRTAQGRAHYRRRKTIPEPVFGWIKQVLGFRSFSLRGMSAVSAEWRLMCTAMNLKRMHRLGWMPG